jgi:hypothetical protein
VQTQVRLNVGAPMSLYKVLLLKELYLEEAVNLGGEARPPRPSSRRGTPNGMHFFNSFTIACNQKYYHVHLKKKNYHVFFLS